jgi:hypothetical protein
MTTVGLNTWRSRAAGYFTAGSPTGGGTAARGAAAAGQRFYRCWQRHAAALHRYAPKLAL